MYKKIIDMRNAVHICGGTSGNLLKDVKMLDGNKKYYIKTGRGSTRDYPNNFGIEPLVEVICYKVGKLLGFNVAHQELGIGVIKNK